MRTALLPILALALGCRPTYDSVDEACPERVPGARGNDEDAISVFRRISCYRRFAGLPSARIDERVSAAARSHALYIEQNGPESASPLLEDPNKPAFTGEDPLARIVARGYDFGGANYYDTIGFWEGVFLNDPSFDPEAIADGWMWGQYTRQGVLQPLWLDGGYGATDAFAVITILYEFPAAQAIRRPVAWPRDGQTGVPTSWVYAYDDGAVDLFEEVGYPITFTVGSDESASAIGSENPYGIYVFDTTLEGPDGPVDHVRITPDLTPYDFPYTVALVADAPFEPSTTYTATVRMQWNAHDTDDFVTTFTTESEATARARPAPVRVLHRPPGGVGGAW